MKSLADHRFRINSNVGIIIIYNIIRRIDAYKYIMLTCRLGLKRVHVVDTTICVYYFKLLPIRFIFLYSSEYSHANNLLLKRFDWISGLKCLRPKSVKLTFLKMQNVIMCFKFLQTTVKTITSSYITCA